MSCLESLTGLSAFEFETSWLRRTQTMRHLYLDYNASTPIAPEVVEAMSGSLKANFGNPSSSHWAGKPARAAVSQARARVAAVLRPSPEEIVFPSGGSEANNHAIKG